MKYLTLIIAAYFCLLAPLASALYDSDKATAENACKPFVDNGLVERIDVIIQPPDGITYNIIPNSGSNEDLAMAGIVGVSLFSVTTAHHPEVTKGIIGLIWDVPTGGSKVLFLDIYSSDLWPITDRTNPTQSEAMQVANAIIERAKQTKESEPKKLSRDVTFTLNGNPVSPGSTSVDSSNPGYISQITRLERSNGNDEPISFVEVNIKTFLDETLKPVNEDKAIKEANDIYINTLSKRHSGVTIEEKKTYDTTLSNGNEVTVHQFKVPFAYNNNLGLFSYMLDSNTIVTVASSENKQDTDEMIKSLKISEMRTVL